MPAVVSIRPHLPTALPSGLLFPLTAPPLAPPGSAFAPAEAVAEATTAVAGEKDFAWGSKLMQAVGSGNPV